MSDVEFGVDLGGTKIEAVVFRDGKSVFRERIQTPQGDYSETLNAIQSLLSRATAATGTTLHQVGIGIPGSLSSATGRVKNANSTCLIGKPLQEDLEKKLNCSVRIQNDANCFVLSEATDGSAVSWNTVFGVILGTGVGGGMVVHGELLSGPNRIAGEWGHNPLPVLPDGSSRECYCGNRNCIETFLSGEGLSKSFAEKTSRSISATEGYQLFQEGDPNAKDVFDRYFDQLACALAGVMNIFDPDGIVLGGGLSNMDVLYQEIPRRWENGYFLIRFKPNSGRLGTVIRAAFGVLLGFGGPVMKTSDLSLYHFDACPFCRRVREAIERLGLTIELRDILQEPRFREELVEGGGKTTVPCLRIQKTDTVEWMYESEEIVKFLEGTDFS